MIKYAEDTVSNSNRLKLLQNFICDLVNVAEILTFYLVKLFLQLQNCPVPAIHLSKQKVYLITSSVMTEGDLQKIMCTDVNLQSYHKVTAAIITGRYEGLDQQLAWLLLMT